MSTTDLTQFNFHGHGVRTLTDEHGEPWWIAKDVCQPLGLDNVSQAVANLDDDEKGSISISDGTPGSPVRAIISESGLYALILRSRKPEAREFKRWVTHEVLPSIRRTGAYTVADPMSLEGIAAILQAGKAALDRAIAAEARAERSEAVVDAIEATHGITITEFHKHYFSETRATDFFALLYRLNLLIDQRGARGRDDRGRIKNGHQHRHPAAAGKRFFYLHGRLDDSGVRREDTRVRPGVPEVELVRFLATKGLTPNPNALTGATTPKEIAA